MICPFQNIGEVTRCERDLLQGLFLAQICERRDTFHLRHGKVCRNEALIAAEFHYGGSAEHGPVLLGLRESYQLRPGPWHFFSALEFKIGYKFRPVGRSQAPHYRTRIAGEESV